MAVQEKASLQGDVLWVVRPGDVDTELKARKWLEKSLDEFELAHPAHIILRFFDFTSGCCSSFFISLLITFMRRVSTHEGRVTLCISDQSLRDMLQVMNLHRLFTIVSCEDEIEWT